MNRCTSPERVVVVMISGVGDVTIPRFGDRSPMEVAHVPTLDAIAAAGLNGLMDPMEPGVACSSFAACMAILGYSASSCPMQSEFFESMETMQLQSFQELHHMSACLLASNNAITSLGMGMGMAKVEVAGAAALHDMALTICAALTVPKGVVSLGEKTAAKTEADLEQAAVAPQDDTMAAAATKFANAPGTASASDIASASKGSSGYQLGLLHVQAVADAAHAGNPELKVRCLEAVDKMVSNVVRHLWDAESAGNGRYTVVVTGDHSTPAMLGKCSHEPVPFAIAHVRHVVQAMGGPDAVRRIPLRTIPLPSPDDAALQPAALLQQAIWQDARRKAAWAGRPWVPGYPAEIFGPWQEPWPQALRADAVRSFDELSAARGALGRFPGCAIMPLIKQFAGVT